MILSNFNSRTEHVIDMKNYGRVDPGFLGRLTCVDCMMESLGCTNQNGKTGCRIVGLGVNPLFNLVHVAGHFLFPMQSVLSLVYSKISDSQVSQSIYDHNCLLSKEITNLVFIRGNWLLK